MDPLRLCRDLIQCVDLGSAPVREVWLRRTLDRIRIAAGASVACLGEERDEGVLRTFVGADGYRHEEREAREGLALLWDTPDPLPRVRSCGPGSGFSPGIDSPGNIEVASFAARRVSPRSARAWLALTRGPHDPEWGDDVLLALELGADALVTALQIEAEMERLEDLAMTDGLTLIPNYRYLRQVLEAEMERARRYGEVFSVVMVDVDNLKQYNAAHGHLAGSEVLQKLAALLRREIRGSDTVAKYGGDEFLIVLPRTVATGALALSERIRRRINEELVGRGGETISCSFGVASFPKDGLDYEGLIASADHVLYDAKLGGRNRVVWTGAVGTGGMAEGSELDRAREITSPPGDRRGAA